MSIDTGLFAGNYYDYSDDEVAIQREFEIGDEIDGSYRDNAFPANNSSLFFDPLHHQKGRSVEMIQWNSIHEGDIIGCNQPTLFMNNIKSHVIIPGACGNSYFINALQLLVCNPNLLKKLLVSDRFQSIGLYTFKFFKNGKWRYVHIDDMIPCRLSGKVHYCRNFNENETFAMLLEKAYAKLHGCYEAISCGLIEKALQDLTAGASVLTLRNELFQLDTVCDEVWNHLETGVKENRLIGCCRSIPDPYGESASSRYGITLGQVYQIIDVQVGTAQPTEDLDQLTIGMICLRTLQSKGGMYCGRWSYGHKLYLEYKEIAYQLRHRTREIQYSRGLGPDPNKENSDLLFDNLEKERHRELTNQRPSIRTTGGDENLAIDPKATSGLPTIFSLADSEDEEDVDTTSYIDKYYVMRMVQPLADDLFWMQIEDFVEIFNRTYFLTDLSLQSERYASKRFVSKWLPKDTIAGAAGPPIMIREEVIEVKLETDRKKRVIPKTGSKQGSSSHNLDESYHDDEEDDHENMVKGKLKPVRKLITKRRPEINETFIDNPMYPFTVTEPTMMSISLFQNDLRWNQGRLGHFSHNVLDIPYMSRGDRLASCMKYSLAIGFIILKLSGLKHRVSAFRLRKIIDISEGLQFSNVCCQTVRLGPGRYVIVPYTHRELDESMEYVLHCQYFSHQIEFETEEITAQKIIDMNQDFSDDENDDLEAPDDNDLLHLKHVDDRNRMGKRLPGDDVVVYEQVSVLSYEKVLESVEGSVQDNQNPWSHLQLNEKNNQQGDDNGNEDDDTEDEKEDEKDEDGLKSPKFPSIDNQSSLQIIQLIAPPKLQRYLTWEYIDIVEQEDISALYEEVGHLAMNVKDIKNEMKKLNGVLRAMKAFNQLPVISPN